MILIDYPEKSQWQELLKRPVMNTESLFGTVQGIIDEYRKFVWYGAGHH